MVCYVLSICILRAIPRDTIWQQHLYACLTGCQLSKIWETCSHYQALVLSDKGITQVDVKVVDSGELLVPAEGYYTISEAVLLENGLIFCTGYVKD